MLPGNASVICHRRTRVHRKPTGLERLSYLAAAVVFLLACVAFHIAPAVAAVKLGMPAQHSVAAAATALMVVAAARPTRKIFRTIARHTVAGLHTR